MRFVRAPTKPPPIERATAPLSTSVALRRGGGRNFSMSLALRRQLLNVNPRQCLVAEQQANCIRQVLLIAEDLDQLVRECGDFGLEVCSQLPINLPARIRRKFIAAAQGILNEPSQLRGCRSSKPHSNGGILGK